jgi:hypothetical protein
MGKREDVFDRNRREANGSPVGRWLDEMAADDLRRVAADDGDPHKWSGVPSFAPGVRVRPACRKELGCRCGRLDCPGVGRTF